MPYWFAFCFILVLIQPAHALVEQQAELKEIDCWFENTSDTSTSCYHHFIHENPDNENSKILQTSVVVFKSTSKNKKQDPVLFLQGGPGQAYITNEYINWTYQNNVLKYWLKDRDVIISEYRGLGLSQPSLKCSELDHETLVNRTHADWHRSFSKCHAELLRQGVDLSQYHALNIVKDLIKLRKALKITQWNLSGHSYGSMIAMLLANQETNFVRSVIAEGVMPPRYRADKLISAEPFIRLLDRLFSMCEDIFYCNDSHSDPEQEWINLLQKLEKHPIPIEADFFGKTYTVHVDNLWFLDVIFNSLYWKRSKTHVPFLVGKMLSGDHDRFTEELIDYYEDTALPIFSFGAFKTFTCNETTLLTEKALNRSELPNWYKKLYLFPDHCEIWTGKSGRSVLEGVSVSFDTPILFISGQLDPVTPAVWIQEILEDFEYGQRFLFPNASHSFIDNETDFCILILKNDFINAPMQKIRQDRCERENLSYPDDWDVATYPNKNNL